jgi:DHA1 family tetracycline resistance protein-like MFS transporter
MSTPYVTVLVHDVEGKSFLVAGSVGLVLGLAQILGAALSPLGGWVADRLGFRTILVAAIGGMAVSFALLAMGTTVAWLAVTYCLAIACGTVVAAMISGLLATEAPAERRSATLNLIYLPLYIGGIAGPTIGAGVVTAGTPAVFIVAAGVLAGATVLAAVFARRTGGRSSADLRAAEHAASAAAPPAATEVAD